MKVRFHPLAERELTTTALYLEKEAGLGGAFLDAYEAWETQIREHPESCPEIGMGVRKGILKRFRYLIGYKIKGTGRAKFIRVLYVRHYTQSRKDWSLRNEDLQHRRQAAD